ncbi:MAG: DUF3990 domain-containing protein [Ruminococcaceae bacterium]|nr:DUF3990 domain-containing protein [Oscillospiraceae bacterium]
MEFSDKLRKILSNNRWFHATTYSDYINIKEKGIIVDHNRGSELDFGYGFYLTTTAKLSESYISRLYRNKLSFNFDETPVVMEFSFVPIDYCSNQTFKFHAFLDFDETFANFVFTNRLNCKTKLQQHDYDLIYGVMSDSAPTRLLLDYRAGELTKEEVILALQKSNSMKQLSIHNQIICSSLELTRAYTYNPNDQKREELNIHE